MKHRIGTALAVLLVWGALSLAPATPAAAGAGSPAREAVVLENGLTLVVVANPQLPAVAHYVF